MAIQDTTSSIATSAKHFFSGTLVSRTTGLIREIAMAAVFGTNPAIAAFWMAFRFAHLLRRLFGEGALHAAFVPHFEALRKEESAKGARFFYDLTIGVSLLLFLFILLLETGLGSLLWFNSISPGNQEVIRLTMILMPAVVFICLYAINTSLLQCERSYFLPSVAPACLNIIWIGALFLVCRQPLVQGIEYLAMILVVAFALQWLVTLPPVLRYLSQELKEKGKRFSVKELVAILRPFALGMIGVAATQVNTALDALFARAADPQGPAYLWYALRIQQLPLALLGVGLTGALLPPISRAIQQQESGRYHYFLNFALKKMVVFLLPVTVALVALGFSGINLVYGHGEFSQEAILNTTLCLWAYGGALVPMSATLIFAAAFYAHKNYRIPALCSVLTVLFNGVLNALFVFVFHLGAISIALSTTLGACFNILLLAYFLRVKSAPLLAVSFKSLLASLLAAGASLTLGALFFHDNTLRWFTGEMFVPFTRGLQGQLMAFGFQAVIFGCVFLLAAYLLGIPEWTDLVRRRKRDALLQ